MSDFRVEVRIKNAILYNYIMNSYDSIKDFTSTHNLAYQSVTQLLNLKHSAVNQKGTWTKTAAAISDALQIPGEFLFPEQLKEIKVATNTKAFEIEAEQLNTMIQNSSADVLAITADVNNAVDNILHNTSLTKREAKVMELRYGLDGGDSMTLKQIADLPEYNVTATRIRQIEARALRKLRRNVCSDIHSPVIDLKETLNFNTEEY